MILNRLTQKIKNIFKLSPKKHEQLNKYLGPLDKN